MAPTRLSEGSDIGNSEQGIWKRVMDSLVSYGYQKELVDANELSIDSSIISAKKGRGRR